MAKLQQDAAVQDRPLETRGLLDPARMMRQVKAVEEHLHQRKPSPRAENYLPGSKLACEQALSLSAATKRSKTMGLPQLGLATDVHRTGRTWAYLQLDEVPKTASMSAHGRLVCISTSLEILQFDAEHDGSLTAKSSKHKLMDKLASGFA